MSTRDYRAQFPDPKTQGELLLELFLQARPLSYRELAGLIATDVSAVAGNCGELRAKSWVTPVVVEGATCMELTVAGTDAVRKMFPSL